MRLTGSRLTLKLRPPTSRVRLIESWLVRIPARKHTTTRARRSGQRQSQLTTRGHALGEDDPALIRIEPQHNHLELLPQSVLYLGCDELRRRVAFDAADLTERQQPVEAVNLDAQSVGR